MRWHACLDVHTACAHREKGEQSERASERERALTWHTLTRTHAQSAHKNIGLAMADLGAACAQLRVVVRLQEILEESAQAQRDWDRLFPCLDEVKATLAYLRAHPTLGQQRELVRAVEEVQSLAMQCLQSHYIQIVEEIPTFPHGDGEQMVLRAASGGKAPVGGTGRRASAAGEKRSGPAAVTLEVGWGGEELQRARNDLARLRTAMITAGEDVAPSLLLELRTEAATAALMGAQPMMEAKRKGASDFQQVASQLLNLLLCERALFTYVLADATREDGEEVDGGGVWGEGEGAKKNPANVPKSARPTAARASENDKASMSEDARMVFDGFCHSLAQVFVGMVDKAIARASGHVPSDQFHAEWGGAAVVAWRFDAALALLDLHQDLTKVLQPLMRLLEDAGGGGGKGGAVSRLQGLVPSGPSSLALCFLFSRSPYA